MRSSVLVFGVSLLMLPAIAEAHFTLLTPPPASNSTNGGKGDPPCGPTDTPSNIVTPVMGGSKLTVKVSETVFHPGFYRIALALKSRAELPADNVVKDASGNVLPATGPGNSASAVFENPAVFPVLADNLFPHTTDMKMYSGEITLPNVNCDKCTLQVIEFMAQHGPNPGGGYFYHHCADLKITADPGKPIFDPTAGSGSGGGSSGGAAGIAGAPSSGGVSGTGTAGAGPGGSVGISGSVGMAGAGISGGGSAGVAAGGSPAAGAVGSVAGATSTAGTTGAPSTGGSTDSGGCSVSTRPTASLPLFSGLLGVLALGGRRKRRR